MKLSKTSNGQYEGTTTKNGFKVSCEASTQSYGGFSYSVFVNGKRVDSDGFKGLRLNAIKTMAATYMVDDAIEMYKKY